MSCYQLTDSEKAVANAWVDHLGAQLIPLMKIAFVQALREHHSETSAEIVQLVGTDQTIKLDTIGITSTEVPGEREVWAQAYSRCYAWVDPGEEYQAALRTEEMRAQRAAKGADEAVKAFRERYK